MTRRDVLECAAALAALIALAAGCAWLGMPWGGV